MLRLLGKAASINVRKVLWTCAELELPVEREDWGSGFRDPQSPEFLALNPNGLVPVLCDGDAVLWESNTICRYLCARAGRTDLLPAEPLARARVEQWMDWQAGELNNSWRDAFMGLVRRSPAHADGHLEATGGWAAGEGFTLADVVLGLSTHRWFSAPMERPALPAVQAYYERLSQRPAFLAHGRNGLP